MTTLAVLQPGYLPWLGYFDQLDRADIFVSYDDVQFDKNGWRNRNRIKAASGPVWLTVPVRSSGRFGQAVAEVEIDTRQPWARKHLRSIRESYARAPFFDAYFPALEAALAQPHERVADLDLALTALIASWLGIATPVHRASTLDISGGQSERLLRLCQHFGADRYLSGNAAQDYLDTAMFAQAGVTVEWQDYSHPTYPQPHGDFISHMAAIDLLFNCGDNSLTVLRAGRPGATHSPR